jgi:hypothetical protein
MLTAKSRFNPDWLQVRFVMENSHSLAALVNTLRPTYQDVDTVLCGFNKTDCAIKLIKASNQ